jgi:pilus assembly protein Flp/PilA
VSNVSIASQVNFAASPLSSSSEVFTLSSVTHSAKGGEHNMTSIYAWLQSLAKDEEGQTMAEYGIILAVVALVAIAGFVVLGTGLDGFIKGVAGKL